MIVAICIIVVLAAGAVCTSRLRKPAIPCCALFAAGFVAHAQTPAGPEYACVQIDGNSLTSFRVLTGGQTCDSAETRMLLVTRRTMFFAANAPRAADEAGRVYAARFMPNSVALTAAYPLFIAITLKVNTDQGMYDIPVQTDTSAGLACLPTLDGQAVGAALALSTDAASLGRAVGSMGRNPDTLWSILRSSPVTATGRHEVALACGAGATFHFRGVAMLTVLQQIPGN